MIAALAMTDESWNEKGSRMLVNQFIATAKTRHHNKLMDDKIKAAELQNDNSVLLELLKEKQKQAMRSAKQKQALLNEK